MARLNFDIYSCVRTYYRFSSCQKCIDVCPVEDVLYIENDKIKINEEKCISCGACVGVCPTEAFSLKGFDLKEFHQKFIETEEHLISCKLNVPCVSAVDSQYLVAFVLEKNSDIILDIGHCSSCQIGNLKERIENIAKEANYVLEQLGVENRVKLEEIAYEKPEEEKKIESRRSFLKRFTKQTAGLAFWALAPNIPIENEENNEEEVKNLVEEKVVPYKRIAFINALKNSDIDFKDKYLEVDKISFTSEKWIDNKKCTNCYICYHMCPTGALKEGNNKLSILFEPALCVKCRICHEMCPEDCLHLADKLEFDTFVNKVEVLAEHVMIPCEECMTPFSYKGDSTICPRCRKLEDEIKDLLKIGD
ncbi:4Fe-4S binding protein [Hydrogenothermus marinus]|uniref:4Fe-4S binding protein n=1 Tax=Hydrogenothermus marinus TaxID=133270 RepID=A0A3M0BMW0_9AQUI|nr:4Fe-4S binding protein [Hydrogenothermus marinus]RMA96158.1 4Fe-4S binding protein [Hydrogenothermus marinus]